MFKRVALLIATNMAVMLLLGLVLSVLQNYFGIALGRNGSLLIMAALFGFGGAFVSLLISKWMAKRTTGFLLL
jgi:heat shock protein HtpX